MKRLFSLSLILAFLAVSALADESCDSRWKKLFPKSIDSRYQKLVGKCDLELKKEMALLISTNTNDNYDSARMEMYSMDLNENGQLCSVYTSKCINYKNGNPSSFNCEHTWPQSKGAVGIAKADIHHLFTVDARTNTVRSNLPFCVVAQGGVADEDHSAVGNDSEGSHCFEPKGLQKAKTARAMFYFSVRYRKTIDQIQEAFLRDWNHRDVTEEEQTRNDNIEKFQHNRNPFVDYPSLVELISDF